MEPPARAPSPAGLLPFLVVFATKHATFRFPELRSLAHLNGVAELKYIYEEDDFIQKDVKLERKGVKRQLPSESGGDGPAAHTKQDYEQQNPYVTVFLPSVECALRIAARSVAIKYRGRSFRFLSISLLTLALSLGRSLSCGDQEIAMKPHWARR